MLSNTKCHIYEPYPLRFPFPPNVTIHVLKVSFAMLQLDTFRPSDATRQSALFYAKPKASLLAAKFLSKFHLAEETVLVGSIGTNLIAKNYFIVSRYGFVVSMTSILGSISYKYFSNGSF